MPHHGRRSRSRAAAHTRGPASTASSITATPQQQPGLWNRIFTPRQSPPPPIQPATAAHVASLEQRLHTLEQQLRHAEQRPQYAAPDRRQNTYLSRRSSTSGSSVSLHSFQPPGSVRSYGSVYNSGGSIVGEEGSSARVDGWQWRAHHPRTSSQAGSRTSDRSRTWSGTVVSAGSGTMREDAGRSRANAMEVSIPGPVSITVTGNVSRLVLTQCCQDRQCRSGSRIGEGYVNRIGRA